MENLPEALRTLWPALRVKLVNSGDLCPLGVIRVGSGLSAFGGIADMNS